MLESDKNINNTLSQNEIREIIRSTESVKQSGFGEVRILIRNGSIHRILKTEDKIITKD